MGTKTANRFNPDDELQVSSLYKNLLESWNKSDAGFFTNLFAEDANVIGFDGSQMNGKEQIYREIAQVFLNHKVASYISIVEGIRTLSATVYVLRAVAGMVPPGDADIMPERNAIQTLVAVKQNGKFQIAVFQNTPAAFHGRPELSEQLTTKLREALRNVKSNIAS